MKFKVGDKVRVRDDLITENCKETYFAFCIKTLQGREFTIKAVHNNYYYFIEFPLGCPETILEPVIKENKKQLEKLIITRDGDKLSGEYHKNGKSVECDIWIHEICIDEKNADTDSAIQILVGQLLQQCKRTDYSLVKCIGCRQTEYFDFTVGKIYKIIYDNGYTIIDDTGYRYCSRDTKEELLDYLSDLYLFEEVESD